MGQAGKVQGDRLLRSWAQAHQGVPLPSQRLGLHASPSLAPLHLHVISDDFHSHCLKKRQHYATFTTPFFLSLDSVITGLRAMGDPGVMSASDEEELSRRHVDEGLGSKGKPFQCYRCSLTGKPAVFFKTLPELKVHLSRCSGLDGNVDPIASTIA